MKLIVEVEMPKIPQNCGECKFHKPLYHTQYCVLERKNCAPWKTRKDWCPIKGVLPNEHGDLIDRSLLCADLAGVILSHSGLGIDEVIARQPAIIAAERKDDEQIH